jgi:exosortase
MSSPAGARDGTSASLANLLLLAILALAALAFREIAGWDPGRHLSSGMEAELLAPSERSPGLVYAVSAFLLFRRRHQLRAAMTAGVGSASGWLLVAPSSALFVWAHFTQAVDLTLLSLILFVPGAGWVLFGRRFARHLVLPSAFLLFAYPPQPALMNQVVFVAQTWTADLAAWALTLAGYSLVHEGDILYVGRHAFEVIETCSGLRITETMLMASIFYCDLVSERRLHTVLTVLAAPLIGFALNFVRVVTIILNPYSEIATIHTLQGLVALVAGVVLLHFFHLGLQRFLPGAPPPSRQEPVAAHSTGNAISGAIVLVATLVALLGVSFVESSWAGSGRPPWSVGLPVQWEGWRARSIEVPKEFLGTVSYSFAIHRRYARGGFEVDVFLGADDRRDRDRSFLSRKNELPGAGWKTLGRRQERLPWAAGPVETLVAQSRGRRVIIHQWYEDTPGVLAEAFRSTLALDSSPFRQEREGVVVRLSTPIGLGEDEEVAARRLEPFGELVRAALDQRPDIASGGGDPG